MRACLHGYALVWGFFRRRKAHAGHVFLLFCHDEPHRLRFGLPPLSPCVFLGYLYSLLCKSAAPICVPGCVVHLLGRRRCCPRFPFSPAAPWRVICLCAAPSLDPYSFSSPLRYNFSVVVRVAVLFCCLGRGDVAVVWRVRVFDGTSPLPPIPPAYPHTLCVRPMQFYPPPV